MNIQYICMCICISTINEKRGHMKESKEGHIGDFRGKKKNGEIM